MIAAIYARKSTDQSGVADEQKSIARQVEHARAYALAKGWTVADAHVYVDDGISGAEFANRPAFLRLMNALKPRAPFQALLMSEVSRLGREQIETAYAMKTLAVAGVRCFSYLEDRELLMESATDKFLLGAVTFAADLEREKARQRTRDAMVRKARAGHVCGGTVYGYENRRVDGHVERVIDPAEAAIVGRIFRLCAEGYGPRAIAKRLNADGVPSPRSQRSWSPSSIWAMLRRPEYRGETVWARTVKRDKWGRKHQRPVPESTWIRRAAPALRIVTDEEWTAAHARIDAARACYINATSGQAFGRPALGNPSRYLLTHLAQCGCCGGTMHVVSRSHGVHRKRFYGCSGFHERGICQNRADVPIDEGDAIVIEALLDDVLDAGILADAVDAAVGLLRGDGAKDHTATIEAQLAKVERERGRLIAAIADGGPLSGLLEALREREALAARLTSERQAIAAQRLSVRDAAGIHDELTALAASWRTVLADDPTHARPIIASLLKGRVTFTPLDRSRWRLNGDGHLIGLFQRELTGRGFVPNGIRTRVLALKGPRPGPLDDGDS